VRTELLHDAYVDYAKRHGERRPVTSAEMAARLVQLCEGCAFRNKRPSGKTTGSRGRVYMLDTLGAYRNAFLAAMKIDPEHYPWPADESEGSRGAEEGVQEGPPEKPSNGAAQSRTSRGPGAPDHPRTENGEGCQRQAGGGDFVSSSDIPLDPLDPLDKARKHAGLGMGKAGTPRGPSWTPDPFAGLDGTLHHTAGYDPYDLTDLLADRHDH
jgi:hypothetical protein